MSASTGGGARSIADAAQKDSEGEGLRALARQMLLQQFDQILGVFDRSGKLTHNARATREHDLAVAWVRACSSARLSYADCCALLDLRPEVGRLWVDRLERDWMTTGACPAELKAVHRRDRGHRETMSDDERDAEGLDYLSKLFGQAEAQALLDLERRRQRG